MVKSGLIFAAVAGALATCTVLLSPLCVPCVALFLGLGTGYLSGVFDRPGENGLAAKAGAGAGAIGGLGSLIGHLLGGAINSVVAGPDATRDLLREFGLPSSGDGFTGGYYLGVFGGGFCLGVFEIALMAGLGALGGILWWQMTGKNQVSAPPPAPPMMPSM